MVAGHKLVLSSDIYENEKRLRSIWKNYVKKSSPLSLSPPPSFSSTDKLTNSLPISRLLNLLTSNHLSYLATSCVNWPMATIQPTNPMQQLVCDYCMKKSTKSINDYIFEAFKIGKKDENSFSTSVSINDFRSTNPFLVCTYCFFTVDYNCLSKVI